MTSPTSLGKPAEPWPRHSPRRGRTHSGAEANAGSAVRARFPTNGVGTNNVQSNKMARDLKFSSDMTIHLRWNRDLTGKIGTIKLLKEIIAKYLHRLHYANIS